MKKNILYLTRTMGLGGTEKVILQLCENLNDEFNKIVVCSSGGIHESKLSKLGIKHYKIPDFEDKSFGNIIKTIKIIKKIIKDENIDIVHTHHRMAAFYASLINRNKKVIQVHTAHNTFFDKKRLTNFALNSVNIIAVGNKVKDNLVDYYGLCKNNVSVIYNGIEEDENNYPKIPELKEISENGYFLVGNIGRLSEQKGMKYFIEAFLEIKQKYKDIKFCIAGDGELKDELINYSKKLNVYDDILFLGYRNDISNVISHCDLIVLSSLWEGLPLTPIEVFMRKKTIVATNVDGTPEIVKDNFNGLLVDSKNSSEISKAIIKIYENINLKEKFEKNAYKTYIDNFTIEEFADKYLKYYMNLIRLYNI
ncbi:TPA: glycosyltransferase family 4 protein [Clostridium perfringens]|uniref:glycosyltransferase family 4 protein n=1 Tax=Clostridia TaxID=186801 RepID=UPI0010EEABE8|nr:MULTISPECIES: glycosyltransferase family 4 protein [Clostridiaceae]EJT5929205.1 glycosyltransferase family 4 protein [Clostridium perfringens]EJT6483917.1 glycosyltransferase family 4 protein [Clostridium perfringens]EJT6614084.1 glycosyltransferase family 4 protein [Clostridium perfringens]MBS5955237.1 glycosyltransferase family 4 protein [Paraclostridium bifermentans]MDG6879460.1 Alpha-D-kanosaminyltransferase [Clostridium perfringens]